MAVKISNSDDHWRVRLADGEYSLSLTELGEWINAGRVRLADHVRPPTTRRWKLVENTPELNHFFSAKWRREAQELWEAEAPAREAAAEKTATFKRRASSLGCVIGLVGFAAVFTGSEWGIVLGGGAAAIGLIIFIIGRAVT